MGVALATVMALGMLTGCGSSNSSSDNASTSKEAFDKTAEISVVSREDGSGTRGAFIELVGVQEKDADGNKIDNTTDKAIITNSTSVMMTSVAGDSAAIGYASLGSLDDSVKALKVEGVDATADNIKNNSYTVSRPFNIVTKEGLSDVAKDFIDYIMSADGQAVIEENKYIKVSENSAYAGTKPSGKIVITGSSSVTPVMEKLKEAYLKINTNAEIEVQENDSTTGVNSAIEGICDIGMASRELDDEETSKGVTSTAIAMDGIAVIVNKENPLEDITKDQIKSIFTGETTTWDAVK